MRGQICYEADINQLKKKVDNWDEALQKGFSFIIDTNDEYDVKNLFERKSPTRLENTFVFNSFLETKDDNKFAVMLKTISEHTRKCRNLQRNDIFILRSHPAPSVRRWSLRSDGHQGCPSEP